MRPRRALAAIAATTLLLGACTPARPARPPANEQARTALNQIRDKAGTDRVSEVWLLVERHADKSPDSLFAVLANTPRTDAMTQHMWSEGRQVESRPWDGQMVWSEGWVTFDQIDVDALTQQASALLDKGECRGFGNELLMSRVELRALGKGRTAARVVCNDVGSAQIHLLDNVPHESPSAKGDVVKAFTDAKVLHRELTGDETLYGISLDQRKDQPLDISVEGGTQVESASGGSCFRNLDVGDILGPPTKLQCSTKPGNFWPAKADAYDPAVLRTVLTRAKITADTPEWSVSGSLHSPGSDTAGPFRWVVKNGADEMHFDAHGDPVKRP